MKVKPQMQTISDFLNCGGSGFPKNPSLMERTITPADIERGLKKPGKSKGGLAKALGIAPQGVTALFTPDSRTGKPRQIKADEVPKIREYLELDRPVPIVGYVGASSEDVYYGENSDAPAEFVSAPTEASTETVAVEIRGNSLGPGFNGWVAYYDDRRTPVTLDLIGRLCVVGLTDGRVLIKTLRKAPGGRFHLLPNAGGEIIHDAKVKWAARVIALLPKS